MTYKLSVFAYDGCFISGIAGPLDVYNIANTHNRVINGPDSEPLFEWKVYSSDGKPFKTSTGLLMPVDGSIEEIQACDICIIPGVDHTYGQEVVERAKQLAQVFGPALKRLHANNATLASNCSGAFIFAEKIMSRNTVIQDMLTFNYYDYKSNNFTSEEIMQKEKQLRHMLKPNTWKEIQVSLTDAGFTAYERIWQNHMFVGAIAIK